MTICARTVIATALLAAIGGCTKYAYYGYQYKVQEEAKGLEPEPAPAEARQLLATAKTVAFYPPDVCLNTDTQISGDRKRVDQLRASCGVLLSSLERAAERAGYEVLSWQNLRGGKRPIDFAREGSVDVLFEINQFDLGPVGSSDVERSLGFFERESGIDTPMNVLSTTADRCAAYAEQTQGLSDLGYTGTIDIKTVSVIDGRTRWLYRKTLSQSSGATSPKVMFGAPRRPHVAESILGTLGVIGLAGGGTLFVLEQVSEDNPLTPEEDGFDTHGASTISMVIGGIALAGAIAIRVAVGGKKPDPSITLCDGKFLAMPEVPKAAPVTTVGTEFKLNTAKSGGGSNKVLDGMREEMIGQFIDILKEVHGNRPSGPPPTLTPAPTVPAPATP